MYFYSFSNLMPDKNNRLRNRVTFMSKYLHITIINTVKIQYKITVTMKMKWP